MAKNTDKVRRTTGEASAGTRVRLLESILCSALDLVIATVDMDFRLTFVNPTAATVFGIPSEQAVGQDIRTIHEDLGVPIERIEHAMTLARTNGTFSFSGSWTIDGAERIFDLELRPLDDDVTGGYLVWGRDVTERHRSDAARRLNETKYHTILEAAGDSILLTDASTGTILEANARLTEITGRSNEELTGLGYLELHPEELRSRYEQLYVAAVEGKVGTERLVLLHRDGHHVTVEATGKIAELDGRTVAIGVFRDITDRLRAEEERRALEARVHRAQRLESLEVMAAGIAHDFNNLLTSVLGHTEVARFRVPADHPVHRQLEYVERSARSAAELSGQMLTYLGQSRPHLTSVDVNRLLSGLEHRLVALTEDRSALQLTLGAELPEIDADPVQLEELLLAVVANAIEASADGGRVVISTSISHRADEEPSYDFLPAGYANRLIALQIEDHGCGMDADTLNRAFEPFFSTGFTGRGLGLATVLGFVRAHQGAISVRSSPGSGTCVRVLLPTERASSPSPKPGSRRAADRPIVLVVDDDSAIREYGLDLLEILGFEGRGVSTGREALAAVADLDGKLVCVLLDLTMPGISGADVIQHIRRTMPGLPIIAVSGYSEDDVRERFGGHQPEAFLQKPFNIAAVREALRSVLDEPLPA